MRKRKAHAFGKDIYLLGTDNNMTAYWLVEPSWDCDWYWGFGYIESYTNNGNPERAKDIDYHGHFDSLKQIGNQRVNMYDGFKHMFVETPLTDGEIWKLCELMQSYYVAREYSDFLNRGGAHYTENPCKETIKNQQEYDRINKVVLPEIFRAVKELLED